MEYICLVCGWKDTIRDSPFDGRSLGYELLTGWTFPNDAPLQELLPEYTHLTHLGFCSRECRYVYEQPIKAADYFRNLPTRVAILSQNRERVQARSVFSTLETGRYYIIIRSSKKYFNTKEEALAQYDKDKYLVSLHENTATRKKLIEAMSLGIESVTSGVASTANEDDESEEVDSDSPWTYVASPQPRFTYEQVMQQVAYLDSRTSITPNQN